MWTTKFSLTLSFCSLYLLTFLFLFLSPLHSFPPSFYLSLLPFFLPSPHSFIHVLVSGHAPGTELGTLQASCYFFLTSLCCRDSYCSFLGNGKIEGQKNYEVFLKQLVPHTNTGPFIASSSPRGPSVAWRSWMHITPGGLSPDTWCWHLGLDDLLSLS